MPDDPHDDCSVDDDIRLAPVECASRDQYEAARSGWKSKMLREAEQPQPTNVNSRQFSIRQLLLLTTLVAIGLGGGALLTPPLFALACGIVAVVSLLAANFQEPSVIRSICWMAVLVYLIAATSAVVWTFCVE